MKIYPQKYEEFFTRPRVANQFCRISEITTDKGFSGEEYKEMWKVLLKGWQRDFFNFVVRFEWMRRRFHYKGKQRLKTHLNGFILDFGYSSFFLTHLNHDSKNFSVMEYFFKTIGYLNDFFPDFDKKNPFIDKKDYLYPYKYMNLDCLYFVHRLEHRMELLEYGEKHKMTIIKFFDFCVNQTMSYGEEVGKKFYIRLRYSKGMGRRLPYHIVPLKEGSKSYV